jgi:hypothetical protein
LLVDSVESQMMHGLFCKPQIAITAKTETFPVGDKSGFGFENIQKKLKMPH